MNGKNGNMRFEGVVDELPCRKGAGLGRGMSPKMRQIFDECERNLGKFVCVRFGGHKEAVSVGNSFRDFVKRNKVKGRAAVRGVVVYVKVDEPLAAEVVVLSPRAEEPEQRTLTPEPVLVREKVVAKRQKRMVRSPKLDAVREGIRDVVALGKPVTSWTVSRRKSVKAVYPNMTAAVRRMRVSANLNRLAMTGEIRRTGEVAKRCVVYELAGSSAAPAPAPKPKPVRFAASKSFDAHKFLKGRRYHYMRAYGWSIEKASQAARWDLESMQEKVVKGRVEKVVKPSFETVGVSADIVLSMLKHVAEGGEQLKYRESSYPLGIESESDWNRFTAEVLMKGGLVAAYLGVKNKWRVRVHGGVCVVSYNNGGGEQ